MRRITFTACFLPKWYYSKVKRFRCVQDALIGLYLNP